MRNIARHRPGQGQRAQALQFSLDRCAIGTGHGQLAGAPGQQGLAGADMPGIDAMQRLVASTRGRFSRLQGAGQRPRHAYIDRAQLVGQHMVEDPAEIAGRWLAGLRQGAAGGHAAIELARGQAQAVQVVAPIQADPHRHDVDAETFRDRHGQVGRAVGQHRQHPRRLRAALLHDHVIGLHRVDVAKPRTGVEQRLRRAGVPVHPHPRAASRNHQRFDPGRRQRSLQARTINGVAGDQAFRAIAMRRIHILVHVRRHRPGIVGGNGRPGVQANRARAALDVLGDAFQPVDEAACTGIDHAGLLQQRHLLRGVGQGCPCPLQRPREAALRVALRLPRRFIQRIREGGDHAEDGALDRLRQRRTRAVGTAPHRLGQAGGIQHRRIPRLLGQAHQELRHDRTGVAACAVDRIVAHPDQQLADVAAATAQCALQDAAEGRGQVAAGVTIRHREDIDAVELFTGGNDPARTRDEGAAQRWGGDGGRSVVSNRHACSLPSEATHCLLPCSIATFPA